MVVRIESLSRRAVTRSESDDIAARFRERAAELRDRVGRRIADVIVDTSPVDSATYIMAHTAGASASEADASRSSEGKVRGQNPAQFRNLARGNLHRSVSSAAVQAAGEIWFRNSSLHAARVEWMGWPAPLFGNPSISGPGPHLVYATARAAAPSIIDAVATEMGMQSR